jgi:adenine deaminase
MGSVSGNLVDPVKRKTYGARVVWSDDGVITAVEPVGDAGPGYILPGFVDSHVHIESSMLPPAAFARVAVLHGSLAAVADPHEIANVLGRRGVMWMIEQARQTPFVFGFGVPSCVPSTPFETSGAALGVADVEGLLALPEITHLSEVMDVPAVLRGDPGMKAKLDAARRAGKPIDGHAPGLSGESLLRYAGAGISTDHECVSLEDARNKLAAGMSVQIRHGSAAPLLETLLQLVGQRPRSCMFCSDDKHPDDLLKHHINYIVAQAFRNGIPIEDIVQAATVNPVRHYHLPLGLLQAGDPADFQIVDDFSICVPRSVWLRGKCVMRDGVSFLPGARPTIENCFEARPVAPADFRVPAPAGRGGEARVIGVQDGMILTRRCSEEPLCVNGEVVSDTGRDILKIAVVNRYRAGVPPAVGLVNGFGLVRGAIASSVSHDSHNIIAVGATDAALAAAVNAVILRRGGLAVADDNSRVAASLPLPIAGLMSDRPAVEVASRYEDCDTLAKMLGSQLSAPFMTLSFLALPVIPELRITDKGLFDGKAFRQVPLFGDPA